MPKCGFEPADTHSVNPTFSFQKFNLSTTDNCELLSCSHFFLFLFKVCLFLYITVEQWTTTPSVS